LKKLVAAIVTGTILSFAAVTTASAETHEVEPGETLWQIAKEYDTTVDELVDVNDLDTTVIQPDQYLYIYSKYVVKRGDTLTSISDKYDVTVDELMEWNDLHTSLIAIGQELKIHGAAIEEENQEAPETNTAAAPEQAVAGEEIDEPSAAANEEPEGKTISVTATAYTAGCEGCSGVTSTGIDLRDSPNAKVIAVDPSVIPLGSEVYVEGYGYAIAGDIGSAIKGNKIDLHVPTKDEAFEWGVRTVNVTVLD